jgi:hypothetical protein
MGFVFKHLLTSTWRVLHALRPSIEQVLALDEKWLPNFGEVILAMARESATNTAKEVHGVLQPSERHMLYQSPQYKDFLAHRRVGRLKKAQEDRSITDGDRF